MLSINVALHSKLLCPQSRPLPVPVPTNQIIHTPGPFLYFNLVFIIPVNHFTESREVFLVSGHIVG